MCSWFCTAFKGSKGREKLQWLRTLPGLAHDPNSVPRTHVRQLTAIYNSSNRGCSAPSVVTLLNIYGIQTYSSKSLCVSVNMHICICLNRSFALGASLMSRLMLIVCVLWVVSLSVCQPNCFRDREYSLVGRVFAYLAQSPRFCPQHCIGMLLQACGPSMQEEAGGRSESSLGT